jgi:hypothetical protein
MSGSSYRSYACVLNSLKVSAVRLDPLPIDLTGSLNMP